MSISKERWIKTGDPRSGNEVYDDEGNELTCTECGDAMEGKTPNERLFHAVLGCHQHCLEAMTPEDHAEYIRKADEELAQRAWFKFEADCKKSGMIAGAYTAFNCGYRAGKFDYETEGR